MDQEQRYAAFLELFENVFRQWDVNHDGKLDLDEIDAVILQLNPDLPRRGVIKQGTRVNIINPDEFENRQIRLERQLRAFIKSKSE